MKRIILIGTVFTLLVLVSCGSRRERCPSVGKIEVSEKVVLDHVV